LEKEGKERAFYHFNIIHPHGLSKSQILHLPLNAETSDMSCPKQTNCFLSQDPQLIIKNTNCWGILRLSQLLRDLLMKPIES
jgi:hypothetical protein